MLASGFVYVALDDESRLKGTREARFVSPQRPARRRAGAEKNKTKE